MAEKLGTRKVLGTALFFTAILTLLTPLVAVWNVNFLIALRILMGVAEAVTFPSLPPLVQRFAFLYYYIYCSLAFLRLPTPKNS